jgi:L-rhamnose mutarotase
MMADIMETEPDATPLQEPLTEMFDLANAGTGQSSEA